jgi:hypothetical protein
MECRDSVTKNGIEMKRISLILLTVLSMFTGLIAQNIDDALRYSQVFYTGTARFNAMGGAFTALGADISTLSQNPAGLGVFRSSELTISPQLFHINTSAGFNRGIQTDQLYKFNLNQAGFVSNIISKESKTGLITLNFGYSFNKTNNFNQNIYIKGVGTVSSMADIWAGNATQDGILYSDLSGPEGIAYDAWVIDTIAGSGGRSYRTAFSNSDYGQNMRRIVSNEGYTGEHAISLGGNYSNRIFFGATFGITTLKYTSHFEHLESTDLAMPSNITNFTYTDHYEDAGTGYSLKIGAIIKPVEALRIGLAFHSPTWFRINEYFYEGMTSNFTDKGYLEAYNEPMRFTYGLSTPLRALAGVAVQIKKIAILSADYEFVDYKMSKFYHIGEYFDYSGDNRDIRNSLKSTSNIRLGGELRLNKLYLRGGYGYYGKAYKTGENNSNKDYSSVSFGAGFREQNVTIDFAYTRLMNSEKYILYDTNVETSMASFSTNRDMFTLTLGYKFGY